MRGQRIIVDPVELDRLSLHTKDATNSILDYGADEGRGDDEELSVAIFSMRNKDGQLEARNAAAKAQMAKLSEAELISLIRRLYLNQNEGEEQMKKTAKAKSRRRHYLKSSKVKEEVRRRHCDERETVDDYRERRGKRDEQRASDDSNPTIESFEYLNERPYYGYPRPADVRNPYPPYYGYNYGYRQPVYNGPMRPSPPPPPPPPPPPGCFGYPYHPSAPHHATNMNRYRNGYGPPPPSGYFGRPHPMPMMVPPPHQYQRYGYKHGYSPYPPPPPSTLRKQPERQKKQPPKSAGIPSTLPGKKEGDTVTVSSSKASRRSVASLLVKQQLKLLEKRKYELDKMKNQKNAGRNGIKTEPTSTEVIQAAELNSSSNNNNNNNNNNLIDDQIQKSARHFPFCLFPKCLCIEGKYFVFQCCC